MNILLVGGGGREHAILKKLAASPLHPTIYVLPGNAGMDDLAQCVPVGAKDIDGIVSFAKANAIDFAVVAPDDPLVLGAVDALEALGIPCFGPRANAAIIEGSKVFAKNLMRKYGIPTAAYETFDDPGKALSYIEKRGVYPVVIKADGLALGKGALIAADHAGAKDALEKIMTEKAFGAAGNHVVVEEFLTGPECTVLAFTDGETVVPMVSSQDHKRALDNDEGLNTGGMGAFSPSRHYTPEIAEICGRTIFIPTINALRSEGIIFKGVIYFQMMLTADGPKVIEYNARFGDPETQAVLPRLDTDFIDIINACIDGGLDRLEIKWKDQAACCVVMASGGYPVRYEKGYPISGLEEASKMKDVYVYHAGTALKDGRIVTSGGRVLGVTALGDTLEDAIAKSYEAVALISWQDEHHRTDIGRK